MPFWKKASEKKKTHKSFYNIWLFCWKEKCLYAIIRLLVLQCLAIFRPLFFHSIPPSRTNLFFSVGENARNLKAYKKNCQIPYMRRHDIKLLKRDSYFHIGRYMVACFFFFYSFQTFAFQINNNFLPNFHFIYHFLNTHTMAKISKQNCIWSHHTHNWHKCVSTSSKLASFILHGYHGIAMCLLFKH